MITGQTVTVAISSTPFYKDDENYKAVVNESEQEHFLQNI